MGAEIAITPLATMFALGFFTGIAAVALAAFLSDHIGR